ncbi:MULTISPECIES: aldo/keto reductase [Intrasporangiaceae]|uniref:Aryl-alcohol dehydrogenase-like predicted oxidoreductase n=1 Tax=Phycicoccus duodecadis TaxID=173053 RepID=A0A2N3YEP1_9MICO|nr:MULTISPECIES: aldo/keto reductase [Intrasporangiaceae]KRE62788.1 aldo/keto reductase [Tetrasphaera sp. Soil756]PKW25307.1 aryl-alcohol dehydrogenase-like predicted oxidoreductase [Phycicoccus duodecadis]
MQTRRLGATGLSVSRLALGTMAWGTRTSPEDARDLLTTFRAAGGTLVDTAHGYAGGAAEDLLGDLLDGPDREEVVLVTKSGISRAGGERVVDCSRRTLLHQLDLSLRRLRTDHVDVWLAHTWDPQTPLEETVSALVHAWRTGRVRYVGVSNHIGWQAARTMSLLAAEGVPLAADSVEYSLVERRPERELVAAGQALGFGLLPWSPLGRGVLGGRYRTGVPADSRLASEEFSRFTGRHAGDHTRGVVEAVRTAAEGLGVPPAVVALAWVRDRPGVTAPVIGPRTPGQLAVLLQSEDVELPDQIVDALDEVSADHA